MRSSLRLDLHVHSVRSPDGRAEIERLVAAASKLRLDGLALTDHNTIEGHRRLTELAREYPDLRLLPGVEVSTLEGHLLAYGIADAPPVRRAVDETTEWVVAQGGVAVLPHPFRRVHGVGEPVARRAAVPALETVNGHNGPSANARAAAVAVSRRLGATGGSDAHGVEELGRAWTRFPEGAGSLDDLLEALRRGTVAAEGRSAGPIYRSGIALRSLGLRLRRGFRPI